MSQELINAQVQNILYSLVKEVNTARELSVGSSIHFTKTSGPSNQATQPATEVPTTVTTADADDLATLIALVNELKRVANLHFADTLGHDSAVTAAIGEADADDLATAQTLNNAMKADYNTHRAEANVHPNNDGGNEVTAAAGSNQATNETLANEIKLDLNAHMALALEGAHISLISA